MKNAKGYLVTVVGFLALLALQGCGSSKLSRETQKIQLPPNPTSSPYVPQNQNIQGSLRVQSSQNLGAQGVEITFIVDAAGASRFRFTSAQNQAPLELYGSATYKRIFASGTTQGSESGLLQGFDSAGTLIGAVNLQTGTFPINNPSQAFCSSVMLNPDPIRIHIGANNQMLEAGKAILKVETTDIAQLVSIESLAVPGTVSATLLSSGSKSHYADLVFNAPGNYALTLRFIGANLQGGSATCVAMANVFALQAAPVCALQLSNNKFNVMPGEMAQVDVEMLFLSTGGPVTSAAINSTAINPAVPKISFALSKGFHVLHGKAQGPGGTGLCDSAVIEVKGYVPTCKLSASPDWHLWGGQRVTLTVEHDNATKSGPATKVTIENVQVPINGGGLDVYPQTTTTFQAKVENENGSSTCKKTVKIGF